MKAQIKAGENVRTRIGQIIGESMYVCASGKDLPEDFIITSTNFEETQYGVRPVGDYQEARDLVKKLNARDER